jgi:hypothetical protein
VHADSPGLAFLACTPGWSRLARPSRVGYIPIAEQSRYRSPPTIISEKAIHSLQECARRLPLPAFPPRKRSLVDADLPCGVLLRCRVGSVKFKNLHVSLMLIY